MLRRVREMEMVWNYRGLEADGVEVGGFEMVLERWKEWRAGIDGPPVVKPTHHPPPPPAGRHHGIRCPEPLQRTPGEKGVEGGGCLYFRKNKIE